MDFEWSEHAFGELCTITRGASPRPINAFLSKTGMPWIKIADATSSDSRFLEATNECIKLEGVKSSVRVFPGDLILSNSATPGLPKFVMLDACIHDGWMLLRDFKGLDKNYAYWLLLNERKNLVAQGNGSVFTNLKTDILKLHRVRIPDLATQTKIAQILDSIAEKIDLNRRINQTLEAMAQAIFKSWFVDFDPIKAKIAAIEQGQDPLRAAMRAISGKTDAELDQMPRKHYDQLAATAALFPDDMGGGGMGDVPQGWKPQRIGDLLELAYGKALKSTDRQEGTVPVYGSGGITGYHNAALVPHGSVIVGRKGTVGSLYWEDEPFFPIDTTYYVKPTNVPLIYCYYAMQTLGLDQMNTDAAVPGLNRENVYRLELVEPDSAVLEQFNETVSSLRKTIHANALTSKLLTRIRDTLLPKLLSGELLTDSLSEEGTS